MSHSQSILLHLCLLLIPYSLHSQQIPRSEADSLLRLLAQSKPDTNRVKVWIGLGQFQVRKAGEFKVDMDSASVYARKAYELSQELKYYIGECRSLNLLGTISRESEELEQSVAYHQSAIRLYSQHRDGKGEADSYLLLAWSRRDKGDVEEARKDVQKALALYKGQSDLEGMGQAYIEWGNTYANYGEDLNEKINYYQQGLQLFATTANKIRQAEVHKDLGDLYQLQGSKTQAMLELRKALALYNSIGYNHVQGIYDLLGNISTEMGDYQEGLKYGLLAVQTAEMLKDSTLQLCTIYNRLGLTYYELRQNQKAYIYFNKAMHIAQKYIDQPSIMFLTHNITSVLNRLGQQRETVKLLLSTVKQYPPQNNWDSTLLASRLLESYTQLKQYSLAQPYYKQLLNLSERLGKNESNRKHIYNSVMRFLVESKQYALAQKYSIEYEEFCRTTNHLLGASRIELYRFKLDSMQANYPSAIRHYQQYKLLEDSLLNESKSRQIANLDVLYETEKKEQDLKLKEQNIKTLTQEKQLQQEQIKQAKLLRNGIIGGAAMLLLLLGVIYNRYRLKQQSNRLLQSQQSKLQDQHEELQTQQASLQAQQQQIQEKNQALEQLLVEKERLLKEIHHRVKNNLQIVMSLLNSQIASLQDKVALSAIQDSQNRVQAMALIHQKLYQAEGVARIPMQAYVEEVVAYLQDTYALSRQVSFKLDIEPIELDVNLAVPLGLIINEAITNAFKYAFPEERPGTVQVSLLQKDDTSYALTIEDDGVGLPKGYDPSQSRSLGMTLIHGFSAQLGGALNIGSSQGVKISLLFTDEKLSPISKKAAYVY
ncbi:histidine kinase dimerization/phosphoacceptor domain -containing protein [Catalinimonas niigatensis]|uniref:histidine kinase dimerization/phosphoacceptor domain -containing protein n=1 Tax=Catalinimonas niigatensis TaxID=1397264 RepID=UPI0026657D6E|nr:histidine kinase dimerization/phosphoacceptor domain -containing protein [Catalinimonas niigatensis]WPP48732.1 histidine kinase dimerization/phosphoacceptor domain -containing protein [Catalinimonas niigatensis]